MAKKDVLFWCLEHGAMIPGFIVFMSLYRDLLCEYSYMISFVIFKIDLV